MVAIEPDDSRRDGADEKTPGRASDEMPTIPVPVPAPRDSGIRLTVTRIECAAAAVDAVVCDLSRDPRSEDYAPPRATPPPPRLRLFDWDTFQFLDEAPLPDLGSSEHDRTDHAPHDSVLRPKKAGG
jgi:hypothetical protein